RFKIIPTVERHRRLDIKLSDERVVDAHSGGRRFVKTSCLKPNRCLEQRLVKAVETCAQKNVTVVACRDDASEVDMKILLWTTREVQHKVIVCRVEHNSHNHIVQVLFRHVLIITAEYVAVVEQTRLFRTDPEQPVDISGLLFRKPLILDSIEDKRQTPVVELVAPFREFIARYPSGYLRFDLIHLAHGRDITTVDKTLGAFKIKRSVTFYVRLNVNAQVTDGGRVGLVEQHVNERVADEPIVGFVGILGEDLSRDVHPDDDIRVEFFRCHIHRKVVIHAAVEKVATVHANGFVKEGYGLCGPERTAE